MYSTGCFFLKFSFLKNIKKYLESTDFNHLGLKIFPLSQDFVRLFIFGPKSAPCRLESVCAKNFVCTKKSKKIAKFQQFLRFFRGEGNEFFGIFQNSPLGNVFRKLDTKFGWPMMTKTCSNCVSTALDKLKFRLIVATSQKTTILRSL